MRCGCPQCKTFMVQADGGASVCICPACGYRCNACLGTGTALTREEVLARKDSAWFTPADSDDAASDPDTDEDWP